MRSVLVAAALLLALGACVPLQGAVAPTPAAPRGQVVEPPRPLADFTLTSHTGAPLGLRDLRGHPVLLFFGYTRCPDVCPTTLAEFVRAKRALGPAAADVRFVFVSVDGSRDPPERLARFMASFDPDFIGLTGDEQHVRRVGADYGLFFERRVVPGTSERYLVDHTAAAYLIDPQGRLRVVYPFGADGSAMADDIAALLAAKA